MGFNYEQLKRIKKNSIVLEKQENIEILQNSTGYSKTKRTFIRERFYDKPPNAFVSNNHQEGRLEPEYPKEKNDLTRAVKDQQNKLEQSRLHDKTFQLANLAKKINYEIEKLQQQRDIISLDKKIMATKKTSPKRQGKTWGEQLAGNSKHNHLEIAKEKFSLQHQCICTSPRYGDDKNLAPRPRMRSVASQMTSRKEYLDQGAVGDHNSHYLNLKAKKAKETFKGNEQIVPNSTQIVQTVNCCYDMIQPQQCYHYQGNYGPPITSGCTPHEYQQIAANSKCERSFYGEECYYCNCPSRPQCGCCGKAATSTHHRRQATDLDTENFYSRPGEDSSCSPQPRCNKIAKRKTQQTFAKTKDPNKEPTEQKKRESEKFKEQASKRQSSKSREANQKRASKEQKIYNMRAEDKSSKYLHHFVNEREKLSPRLTQCKAKQISNNPTAPETSVKVRTETKSCQVTVRKKQLVSDACTELANIYDNVSLEESQYSSKTIHMLKSLRIREYKPAKPKEKFGGEENKQKLDAMNEYKKRTEKENNYQQYLEKYAKENAEVLYKLAKTLRKQESEELPIFKKQAQTSGKENYHLELKEQDSKATTNLTSYHQEGQQEFENKSQKHNRQEIAKTISENKSCETLRESEDSARGKTIGEKVTAEEPDKNFHKDDQAADLEYQKICSKDHNVCKENITTSTDYINTCGETKVEEENCEQMRARYEATKTRDSLQQIAFPVRGDLEKSLGVDEYPYENETYKESRETTELTRTGKFGYKSEKPEQYPIESFREAKEATRETENSAKYGHQRCDSLNDIIITNSVDYHTGISRTLDPQKETSHYPKPYRRQKYEAQKDQVEQLIGSSCSPEIQTNNDAKPELSESAIYPLKQENEKFYKESSYSLEPFRKQNYEAQIDEIEQQQQGSSYSSEIQTKNDTKPELSESALYPLKQENENFYKETPYSLEPFRKQNYEAQTDGVEQQGSSYSSEIQTKDDAKPKLSESTLYPLKHENENFYKETLYSLEAFSRQKYEAQIDRVEQQGSSYSPQVQTKNDAKPELSESALYPLKQENGHFLPQKTQMYMAKEFQELEQKSQTPSYDGFKHVLHHNLERFTSTHSYSQTENHFISEKLNTQISKQTFTEEADTQQSSQRVNTTEDALKYLENFLKSLQQGNDMEELCLNSLTSAANDLITRLSSCKSSLTNQILIATKEDNEQAEKSSEDNSTLHLEAKTTADIQYKDLESSPESSNFKLKEQNKEQEIFSDLMETKENTSEGEEKFTTVIFKENNTQKLESLPTMKGLAQLNINRDLEANELFEQPSYYPQSQSNTQHWPTIETHQRQQEECHTVPSSLELLGEFASKEIIHHDMSYKQENCQNFTENHYIPKDFSNSSKQKIFYADLMPLKDIFKPYGITESQSDLESFRTASVVSFKQKQYISIQGQSSMGFRQGEESSTQHAIANMETFVTKDLHSISKKANKFKFTEDTTAVQQLFCQYCQLETESAVVENFPLHNSPTSYSVQMPEFNQCPCMWDMYVKMMRNFYKGKKNKY